MELLCNTSSELPESQGWQVGGWLAAGVAGLLVVVVGAELT